MLLIDTYLDRSPIHGIGVFAGQDIAEGALIWRFDPVIDRVISLDEFAELPPRTQAMVTRYAEFYPNESIFILSGDNDRFMNHCTKPNTRSESRHAYANRSISAGSEITCDYRSVVVLDFQIMAHTS